MAIKSAYHKTDEMGSFSGNAFYTDSRHYNASDTVFVISSKTSSGSLTPFLEGKFKVVNTKKENKNINGNTFNYVSTLTEIMRPEQPISLVDTQNRMGKRAFASMFMNVSKPTLDKDTVNEFDLILQATADGATRSNGFEDSLAQDIEDILQSDTEALRQVLARIGQDKFRKNVSDAWGATSEMCALTGLELPAILTASHIVPWRECVGSDINLRMEGANGVLLCSNYDRLFDRHLISFKRKGNSARIVISKSLDKYVCHQLSVSEDLELVPNRMSASNRDLFFQCMARHETTFSDKEKKR